jgi:hypothetical protein
LAFSLMGGVQALVLGMQAVSRVLDHAVQAATLLVERVHDAVEVGAHGAFPQLLLKRFEVAFFDAREGALGDARCGAVDRFGHAPELLPTGARRITRKRFVPVLQRERAALAGVVDWVELAEAHTLAAQLQHQLQRPAMRVSPANPIAHGLCGRGGQGVEGVHQRRQQRAFARLVVADEAVQPRVELERHTLAEPPVALQSEHQKAHHSRPPRSK